MVAEPPGPRLPLAGRKVPCWQVMVKESDAFPALPTLKVTPGVGWPALVCTLALAGWRVRMPALPPPPESSTQLPFTQRLPAGQSESTSHGVQSTQRSVQETRAAGNRIVPAHYLSFTLCDI